MMANFKKAALLLFVVSVLVPGCSDSAGLACAAVDEATGECLPCRVTVDLTEFLNADGELPELEPPMTAEQIENERLGFSWDATSPLAETNQDGQAALYYVRILLNEPAAEDILELMGIYYDSMPLFQEEWERWDGQAGFVTLEHDGEAAALWAFLPGAVYNLLREAALAEEDIFGPIIVLDVPVQEAVLADGTLSYDYLVERDFTYGATESQLAELSEELEAGAAVGALQAFDDDDRTVKRRRRLRRVFRRGFVRRLIRAIALVVREVINGIRELGGLFRLKRDFTFEGPFGNVVDTEFDVADPAVAGSPAQIVSSWGGRLGEPLTFAGSQLIVRTGFTITRERLDRNGFVSMRVPRDGNYGIVLRLKNDDVQIMGGFGAWERRLVLYGVGGLSDRWRESDRDSPMNVTWSEPVRDRITNVFLIASDAARYLRDVMDVEPQKVLINVARNARAKELGGEESDYASYYDWDAERLENVSEALLNGFRGTLLGAARTGCGTIMNEFSFVPGLGSAHIADAIASNWGEFDINMHGASGLSRHVAAHEYGHWVMCQMIRENAYHKFPFIMEGIMWQAMDVENGGMMANLGESWADFYSSQTTGTVDYFRMQSGSGYSSAERPADTGYIDLVDGWVCDGSGAGGGGRAVCLEDNVSGLAGGGTHPNQEYSYSGSRDWVIAREVTLWTDIVDGYVATVPSNQPGNGTTWSYSIAPSSLNRGSSTPVRGTDWADEAVALSGTQLADFWSTWGNSVRGARWWFIDVHTAQAETMKNSGYSAAEICQVFALHDPMGLCSNFIDVTALFGGFPPSAPTMMLGVPIGPTLRGDADRVTVTWADVSPDSDGYVVTVRADGAILEEFTGEMAASTGSYTSGDLPFDAQIEVDVRVTNDGLTSLPAVFTYRTNAEPVVLPVIFGSQSSISVLWAATAASEYILWARDYPGGIPYEAGRTSGIGLAATPSVSTEYWVDAVNTDGVIAPFSSDVLLHDVIIIP